MERMKYKVASCTYVGMYTGKKKKKPPERPHLLSFFSNCSSSCLALPFACFAASKPFIGSFSLSLYDSLQLPTQSCRCLVPFTIQVREFDASHTLYFLVDKIVKVRVSRVLALVNHCYKIVDDSSLELTFGVGAYGATWGEQFAFARPFSYRHRFQESKGEPAHPPRRGTNFEYQHSWAQYQETHNVVKKNWRLKVQGDEARKTRSKIMKLKDTLGVWVDESSQIESIIEGKDDGTMGMPVCFHSNGTHASHVTCCPVPLPSSSTFDQPPSAQPPSSLLRRTDYGGILRQKPDHVPPFTALLTTQDSHFLTPFPFLSHLPSNRAHKPSPTFVATGTGHDGYPQKFDFALPFSTQVKI
ncbi:hypothetical protein Cgig2_003634 [Carnegiea gigantea]|uniref:Uncharacterized protein n=1 Tax=Carnegiea gigantea TaxID=171969 RepID=A0A9Q1JMP5_9CARY|nr:hypothetical protein Cgig2_003634 [Carnegiea gigantea]